MIVGICGSPRNGATEHVLREALTMLETMGFTTEFFTVRGKNIGFCTHCDHCLAHKECIIKDDMNTVYSLLKEAEGIIIATPVYNGGISAQTKALMDRCRALLAANPKVFKYKIGMAIAVGGDRIGGQELAIQQIHTFYILNEVIPVSGGSFGANLGANFWSKDTLEGVTVTQLPDGSEMKIRVRKEDAEHAKKLAAMDGLVILEKPEEIPHVFQKHFKPHNE